MQQRLSGYRLFEDTCLKKPSGRPEVVAFEACMAGFENAGDCDHSNLTSGPILGEWASIFVYYDQIRDGYLTASRSLPTSVVDLMICLARSVPASSDRAVSEPQIGAI